MSNIFNLSHQSLKPKVYLCRKDYSRIGEITAFLSDMAVSMRFGNPDEITFTVHKSIDTFVNPYWHDIVNLKLAYIYDFNEYFEIEVKNEENETELKHITARSLCEAELSNLNISVEVNTDTDISRSDYSPTVVYNPHNPSASLLHRILKDKAPHYAISHVDSSLASLQRTFSIDNNIDDFLRQELSQEIDAYVEYDTADRSISLYDMMSVCNGCGHRGNYYDKCPVCGHTDVRNGYGEWTNVYVSTDNLAEDVTLSAETATIKNCFKVVGGDDNITNRIPSVNPNGTGYIVKFSDLQYDDMPIELSDKLKAYDALCRSKKDEYKNVTLNICECLDKILYYQSGMMPSPSTSGTDSSQEISNITDDLSALMSNSQPPNTIGINTFGKFTTASLVNRAVLSYVKILLSPDYEVSVKSSSYCYDESHGYGVWKGVLHVNSVSYPDTDRADSGEITLKVDGNAIAYVTQKIDKALASKDLKDETYDYSLYCVDALQNFIDAYEACEAILVDHGDSGMGTDTPQYAIYDKYRNLKESAVTEQMRKKSMVDEWTHKKETYEAKQKEINGLLNLQNYLGNDLFKLYCAYRRDDRYQNNNYVSDGLSDADLLKRAEKLLDTADEELETACRNQYSLTATVNNLFMMDEFAPFHDKCRLGNWIYAEINGSVFQLRLTKIGVNYEDLEQVSVEFSNVREIYNSSASIKDILNNAQSIAASYPATVRQVSEDSKTVSQVNNWVDNGLNATNMMIANSPVQNTVLDENGIWCRGYDEISGIFEPTQLRIVNSTLAVTDDSWTTTKAAIGKYIMQDPVTGEYRYAMGVIGETIIGKILLGENLGIYNSGQSMTFDKDGLKITNGKNTFTVNPNSNELLAISNTKQKVLYVDTDGMLHISGDGAGLDLKLNDSIKGLSNEISVTAKGLEGRIVSVSEGLSHDLSITAEGLESKITATDGRVTSLSSTVDGLTTEVADKVSSSVFEQTAHEIGISIASKVGNNEIIASINASTEGIKILGNKVDITGKVTFSSFTSDLQNSINAIGSNASDAKHKTDGLAAGTTVINGGCISTGTINADLITSGTIDAKKVNVVNVKASSVDAENITGTIITGKTIKGGNIEGTNLSGCAGGFTSIFLHNKNFIDSFQHGSICGQYLNGDGSVSQHEVMRINNMSDRSDMYVYTPMYFYHSNAYPVFNPIAGIRFGNKFLGSDLCQYPAYINMLHLGNLSDTGKTGIRMGFKHDTNDIPSFEIYDTIQNDGININIEGTRYNGIYHTISAKVFGNLEIAGTIIDQSSEKYKTNIKPLSDGDALNLLKYNIISFDYKDGRRYRHGMLAEEAAEISEYAVVRDKNREPDAISYVSFIPDIIKLNQIMYGEIQNIKQKIEQLGSAE